MFSTGLDKTLEHKENSSNRSVDNRDSLPLLAVMQRFQVCSQVQHKALQIAATKDVCKEKIQDSLLNAEVLVQQQLNKSVEERLLSVGNKEDETKSIHSVIKQNKPLTFESLYDVTVEKKSIEKQTILKADRNVLQRLVTVYETSKSRGN